MKKMVSHHWTTELPLDQTLEVLGQLAQRQCRQGGAVGLQILPLIQKRDYKAICSFELDYGIDWDISQLIACRQALAYFTKLEDLDIGVDKTQVAFDKFLRAESECYSSNLAFRSIREGSSFMSQRDSKILYRARDFIRRVLGRAPRIGDLGLRFGPGATTSIKRNRSCPTFKMAETPVCSPELLSYNILSELSDACPHWFSQHEANYRIDDEGYLVTSLNVILSTGSLQFVPKSAKTFRCIDIQPTLNSLVQAGIGDFMFRKLSRSGLDLRDATLNRRCAAEGSITGRLATIDLSDASDTISHQLVQFLLPDDWFRLLSACRCGTTSFKGKEYVLNKFSSMGNGFTFPLESLIFWALTKSTQDICHSGKPSPECTVYGDDIICLSDLYAEVVRTLRFCGFTVNSSKSYSDGPFRESCGGDYYKGINIRPFYQKHLVSGRTLFSLHNFLYTNHDEEECAFVRSLIPTALRLYGPPGYGDGHLHSCSWNPSPKTTRKGRSKGFGGVFFESYSLVGRSIRTPYAGDWISPLYSIYVSNGESVLPSDWNLPIREREVTKLDKGGYPLWVVPGVEPDRYEKRMIYTFSRS